LSLVMVALRERKINHKLSDVLGVSVDELLACKYHSTENVNKKGVFAMKNKILKKVEENLHNLYGEILPIEITNRYLNEIHELKHTDMLVLLNLLSELNNKADSVKEHIRVKGVTGNSFISYVLGSTEINPLKAHYYCPNCKKVEFVDTVDCGWDLQRKQCSCGAEYIRDGFNIMFETIRYSIEPGCIELFVSQNFFENTKAAIREYFKECKILALVHEQEPEIETFVIINDENSEYNDSQCLDFNRNFGKFNRYPTIRLMINNELDKFKLLEESTGVRFNSINCIDSSLIEDFKKETIGISGFDSEFIQEIIAKVKPNTFNDLIKIIGFSKGSNVWEKNAEYLIEKGKVANELIAFPSDIFNCIQRNLIAKGISHTEFAYEITQNTRKGIYGIRGIPTETKQQLLSLGVEDWLIDFIEKTRYLSPKVNSIIETKYALILMSYKNNYPTIFKNIYQV